MYKIVEVNKIDIKSVYFDFLSPFYHLFIEQKDYIHNKYVLFL